MEEEKGKKTDTGSKEQDYNPKTPLTPNRWNELSGLAMRELSDRFASDLDAPNLGMLMQSFEAGKIPERVKEAVLKASANREKNYKSTLHYKAEELTDLLFRFQDSIGQNRYRADKTIELQGTEDRHKEMPQNHKLNKKPDLIRYIVEADKGVVKVRVEYEKTVKRVYADRREPIYGRDSQEMFVLTAAPSRERSALGKLAHKDKTLPKEVYAIVDKKNMPLVEFLSYYASMLNSSDTKKRGMIYTLALTNLESALFKEIDSALGKINELTFGKKE